jgi:zinc-ribbon domain
MSVEFGVVVGIALAVATVIAIVLPLRASPQSPIEDTSNRADLMARRESAFQVLRDLDSDFEAGKLSEEDYRPMRVQLLAQAAEIMAQLDAAQAPPVKTAAAGNKPATGRRRAQQEVDKFCPHCGASRGQTDEFCRKCGKPLT